MEGPFRVDFTNGSYILWDWLDGKFRISYYNKTSTKASDMEMGLSIVMKKPIHNKSVHDLFKYIKATPEYEEIDASISTS